MLGGAVNIILQMKETINMKKLQSICSFERKVFLEWLEFTLCLGTGTIIAFDCRQLTPRGSKLATLTVRVLQLASESNSIVFVTLFLQTPIIFGPIIAIETLYRYVLILKNDKCPRTFQARLLNSYVRACSQRIWRTTDVTGLPVLMTSLSFVASTSLIQSFPPSRSLSLSLSLWAHE